MSNRLIHSTSPYLLQHAHNPVDWYEWSEEALQKAIREDKPIIVSIGYSSCHWCHVMERESFESEDIAQLMNENFICIKVDREERPDVDQVYMDAVQAMGMNGGWPLNVFLTPQQKPFYGGTYFPHRNWAALLINVSKAYQEQKQEIIKSAEEISQHLNVSDLHRFAGAQSPFNIELINAMFSTLQSKYDTVFGGLDKAPKFVMPSIWHFLLRYNYITKNEQPLNMVSHSLTMIAAGGIFDQIGGGFARYSVDGRWFAPHFEKMLYDNAQLLSLYAEAYTITRKSTFKSTLEKTIDWLKREMTHSEGGFYSALDADSEGVEGKFYTWTYQDFKEVIDEGLIEAWYNIKSNGNWEHGQNILTVPDDAKEFASTYKIDEQELTKRIERAEKKLFQKRTERVRPSLDDKILLGWNAMMISGLVDASLALDDNKSLNMAEASIQFIEKNMMGNNVVYRSFKGKHSTTTGFLEDYAFLIQAYIKLYQATFKEIYLLNAKRWCELVMNEFYDSTDGYFHFSSASAERLIARKKEIFDNVIPSGNSVMARNLLVLSDYFNQQEWKDIADNMISKLGTIISTETSYMSNWAMAYLEVMKGFDEIAISGADYISIRKEFGKHFLPMATFAGSNSKSSLPVLEGREPKSETLIYVCRDKTCQLPVNDFKEALKRL